MGLQSVFMRHRGCDVRVIIPVVLCDLPLIAVLCKSRGSGRRSWTVRGNRSSRQSARWRWWRWSSLRRRSCSCAWHGRWRSTSPSAGWRHRGRIVTVELRGCRQPRRRRHRRRGRGDRGQGWGCPSHWRLFTSWCLQGPRSRQLIICFRTLRFGSVRHRSRRRGRSRWVSVSKISL